MRILIVADTYYPHVNGASYFAQNLAFYLKEHGHDVLVVAPSRSVRSGFFEHQGVRVWGVSSWPTPVKRNEFRFSIPFFSRKKIKQVIQKFQPNIIHAQSHFMLGNAVISIAKELNIPVVGTNHFMPENLVHYFHLPPKLELAVKNWAWKQFRQIYEPLEVVTAPTATAANLAKGFGFSKEILPISCGVDLRHFNLETDKKQLKGRYHLPPKPLLFYIGRLDKEKNLDFALRAFALAQKKVDFHFVIAGKGQEKNNLKELAKKLGVVGDVTFTGFVPDEDKPHLFKLMDCFIIACEAELQSIVTMEALAAKLPVVGVNAVALPELIHPNENGFLFEPGDLKSASEYLIRIFSDENLRKKMGERSYELAQKHDINRTIEEFEKVYRQAIDLHSQKKEE